MAVIGMATQRMGEILEECKAAQEKLRALEEETDGSVRQLENAWQGESKVAYMERWAEARGQMDEAVWTVDSIKNLLEQAITEMKQADEKAAGASR